MAGISATEYARLGRVRPELLPLLVALVDAANSAGYTTAIPEYGGTRSADTQAALYQDSLRQGGGTLAYPVGAPGTSRHEYGAAFDLHIIAGGSGPAGAGSDADYQALADLAPDGLRAGYYFTHSDPFHFELAETLAQSRAAWQTMGAGNSGPLGGASSLALVIVGALLLGALVRR